MMRRLRVNALKSAVSARLPHRAESRLTRGECLGYYLRPHAEVAELADAQDSKSCGTWYHGGSTPPFGTLQPRSQPHPVCTIPGAFSQWRDIHQFPSRPRGSAPMHPGECRRCTFWSYVSPQGEVFVFMEPKTNPRVLSPHFSPDFYCGGGSGHGYCVALRRAPRRTVEYACGALGRAGRMRRMRLVSMPVCASSLRNLVRKAG